MRLFHFSEDAEIISFKPRVIAVSTQRRNGEDWLNDPLVWAIDERHQFLYLFPRDCPRILIWPLQDSTDFDKQNWMRNTQAKALVFIETSWLKRLKSEVIYRYELPIHSFKSIADVGMWVSKHPVDPLNVVKIKDLPSQLMARNIELRVLDSLLPLKDAWNSTLHTSGIKLRNAKGWI